MNNRLKKVQRINDYEIMLVNLARRQKVAIDYLSTHNMATDLYNGRTFHSQNLGRYTLVKKRLRNRINTLLNELKYEN